MEFTSKEIFEDLEHLSKRLPPNLIDSELRHYSVILRKLLLENCLGKAWKQVGFDKQPKLVANDLTRSPNYSKVNEIEKYAAAAGGGISNLIGKKNYVYTPLVYDADKNSLFVESLMGNGEFHTMFTVEVSLSKFLENNCIVTCAGNISRRELIIYYLYILGGAHPSGKMKAKLTPLKEKIEQITPILNKFSNAIHGISGIPEGISGVLGIEFFSIFQSIMAAPDVMKLKVELSETIAS